MANLIKETEKKATNMALGYTKTQSKGKNMKVTEEVTKNMTGKPKSFIEMGLS